MALASNALIDLDYFLRAMDLDETDLKTPTSVLELYIDAASQLIADLCGRAFVAGTTSDIFDGNGTREYFVSQGNITTTPSVYYWDGDSFEATTYTFTYDANTGRVYFTDGNVFYAGKDNWKVTYAYGYSAIPNDIRLACAVLANHLFKTAQKTGVSSESFGDSSVAYALGNTAIGRSAALPDIVKTVMDKYRIVTYG